MHSIRETAAASDVKTYIDFMRAFLEEYGRVDGELRVD
jgi:aspartyl aminopeptidase